MTEKIEKRAASATVQKGVMGQPGHLIRCLWKMGTAVGQRLITSCTVNSAISSAVGICFDCGLGPQTTIHEWSEYRR